MNKGEPEGVALLLTPEEAARLLKIGRTKVYGLLARGELPRIRVGSSVRVPRQALEAWVAAHTDEATAA